MARADGDNPKYSFAEHVARLPFRKPGRRRPIGRAAQAGGRPGLNMRRPSLPNGHSSRPIESRESTSSDRSGSRCVCRNWWRAGNRRTAGTGGIAGVQGRPGRFRVRLTRRCFRELFALGDHGKVLGIDNAAEFNRNGEYRTVCRGYWRWPQTILLVFANVRLELQFTAVDQP